MNRPGNRFTESPKTPPTPEVEFQEVLVLDCETKTKTSFQANRQNLLV